MSDGMIEIAPLPVDISAERLAALAAPLQGRPDRFQAYFGDDVVEIVAEIEEVPAWRDVTWIARSGDRLVGWVLAEHDDEIGRVWWWGPVVDTDIDAADVSDRLVAAALAVLGDRFGQYEFAVDERHHDAIALAERLGYRRDTGSVLLRLDRSAPRSVEDPAADVVVTEPTDETGPAAAALHDRLFPEGHLTGRQLVASAAEDTVLVAVLDDAVVGYLRAELQPGGDGYIDFVGVEPADRSRGVGRALVRAAIERLDAAGADAVNLTVREDNAAARALYARLGFHGRRVLVPLRRGFAP